MAVTNTGIVERVITGVNESDLWLDTEATSVVSNTGIVERSVTGVHDANFVRPLGDELIANGSFDADSDWNKEIGWSISGGSLNASATTLQAFQLDTGIVTDKTYKVTYTISNYISGSVRIELGSFNVSVGTPRSANGTYTEYIIALGNDSVLFDGITSFIGSIDNISVKEVLVNRESTATNTGIVERGVTGVNESDLWLDSESTSVVSNTGIVERPITGVNESDPMFPDNATSSVVNIAEVIIPLLNSLEARATTFENEDATQEILINLQKC